MKHSPQNEQFHTHQCVQTLCTIGMCNKAQLKRKGIKHVLWLLFVGNIIDKSYYQSLMDCVDGIKESDLETHYCTAFGPNQGCAKEWQEIIDNFEQAVLELQEFNRQVTRHPQKLPVLTPEMIADEFDSYTVAAFQKDNNSSVVDLPEFHKAKDLHARVKILFQNIKQKFPQLQNNQVSAVTPPSVIFQTTVRSPFLSTSPEGQRSHYDDSTPRPEFTGEVISTQSVNGNTQQSINGNTQQLNDAQSKPLNFSSKINSPDTFDDSDNNDNNTNKDNNSNTKQIKKKKRPKNKLPWWWKSSTAKRPNKKSKSKSPQKKKETKAEEKTIKIVGNKEDIERLRTMLKKPSKDEKSKSRKTSKSIKSKSRKTSKSLKSKSRKQSRKTSKSIKSKSSKQSRKTSKSKSIKSNKRK